MLILDVPFSEKDKAKSLGAKWNPELKKWYVENVDDYYKFVDWISADIISLGDCDCKSNYIICNHFYVVVGQRECFRCHKSTSVIAFVIDDYVECDTFKHKTDEAILCSFIEGLPKNIYDLLADNYLFRYDFSKFSSSYYVANHCQNCGVLQGRFFLFEDTQYPFFAEPDNLTIFEVKLVNDLYSRIGYVRQYNSMLNKCKSILTSTQCFLSDKLDENNNEKVILYYYNQDTKQISKNHSYIMEPDLVEADFTYNEPDKDLIDDFIVDNNKSYNSSTVVLSSDPVSSHTNSIIKNNNISDYGLVKNIVSTISLPIVFILSIILGLLSFNSYGKSLNPNPTGIADWLHTLDIRINNKGSEYVKWFFDAPMKSKIICLLIILVTSLILLSLCKLDDTLRNLPGGEFLKELCDYDFNNLLRLIPAFIFSIYIFVYFLVKCFNEKAMFELNHFSWSFEGYTGGQVITQIFLILIFCAFAFLIFDSFISAGFIGGVFHVLCIFTSNILMMVLAAFLGVAAGLLLIIIVAIVVLIIAIKLIFGSLIIFS